MHSPKLLALAAILACGMSACSTLPPKTTARQLGSLRYGMHRSEVQRIAGSEGLRDRFFRVNGADYSIHEFTVARSEFYAVALYGKDRLESLVHVGVGEMLWMNKMNNRDLPFAQWLAGYVDSMRKKRLPLNEKAISEGLSGHPEAQFPFFIGVIAVPLLAAALPVWAVQAPFVGPADARFQSRWKQLRLGMSSDEVDRLLGKPAVVRRVKNSADEVRGYHRQSGAVGLSNGRLMWVADYYYWGS